MSEEMVRRKLSDKDALALGYEVAELKIKMSVKENALALAKSDWNDNKAAREKEIKDLDLEIGSKCVDIKHGYVEESAQVTFEYKGKEVVV